MKKGDYQKKNGFTIIEVALVLAIAGLIFLMVFVALPQLQRQQRDSRRRDDILMFLETVKKYQTNNRGALPEGPNANTIIFSTDSGTEWKDFYDAYLGNNFVDPSGGNYQLVVMKCDYNGNLSIGTDCPGFTVSNNWKLDELTNKAFPNGNQIYVVLQATCEGDKAVKVSNPRNLAALYRMEGAGVYCANT